MKRTLNTTINRSKNEKNDEHYTQLSDIEDEVRHYRSQFAGKTVLCNCDDPRSSNFFKYFTRSFEILGLKRVIATCYKSQDVDLFTVKKCERAVYQIYDGDANGNNEVYDDWNLIHETIYAIDGGTTNVTEVQYFWGLDLSDTLQGAGGVGGLLAVSRNGQFYFPAYDNNGNVTKYIDESGNIVATYEYDDFGRTISKSGPLAAFFRHRFSTKYYDAETGLYYYGYRFYHPVLMRWFNRDPIEEEGGYNLYTFCRNNGLNHHDKLGNAAALTWMPRKPVSGWYFSPVVWDELSESHNFTVSYTMSETERKCCHSVTVDRYVRKILGIGNRFGSYGIDHVADGGMTDAFEPYIGYAEGDSPDGQTLFIYRLPWTQSFKWEARCTSGPNKGKILSTIEREFKTSGHWLWNPKREGRFL